MKTIVHNLQNFWKSNIGKPIVAKIIFISLGITSTVWFLFRVIPKPSRATYPCMQASAPLMSGFVIYLLTLTGSMAAYRKARLSFINAKYLYTIS